MSGRLSRREGFLLLTLLVVFLGYAFINYVHMPMVSKAQELEDEIIYWENNLYEVSREKARLDAASEDYEELYGRQQELIGYTPSYIDVAQWLRDIEALLEDSGLDILELSFDGSEPYYLGQVDFQPVNQSLIKGSASVSVKGEFMEHYAFLEGLLEFVPRVWVEAIDLRLADELLVGQYEVVVYLVTNDEELPEIPLADVPAVPERNPFLRELGD